MRKKRVWGGEKLKGRHGGKVEERISVKTFKNGPDGRRIGFLRRRFGAEKGKCPGDKLS